VPTLLQEDRRCQVVGVSSDGLDGIEKARELKPELVFVDVGLPNSNGIDAASRARQVSPESRVIFLSENSDPETVRTAFTVGAQGYILKSDATTDLRAGVRAVRRGKRFVSYSLAISHSAQRRNERRRMILGEKPGQLADPVMGNRVIRGGGGR
jgi:DNA-binding NarL/FixJ family response regulator